MSHSGSGGGGGSLVSLPYDPTCDAAQKAKPHQKSMGVAPLQNEIEPHTSERGWWKKERGGTKDTPLHKGGLEPPLSGTISQPP